MEKQEVVAEVNRRMETGPRRSRIAWWNRVRKQYVQMLRRDYAEHFEGLKPDERKFVEILTAEGTMVEDGYCDPR